MGCGGMCLWNVFADGKGLRGKGRPGKRQNREQPEHRPQKRGNGVESRG